MTLVHHLQSLYILLGSAGIKRMDPRQTDNQVVNGVTSDKSTNVNVNATNERHSSDDGTEQQSTKGTDVARARWTILRQVREQLWHDKDGIIQREKTLHLTLDCSLVHVSV